jgi:ribosomal protein L11 methyltransferase
MNDQQKNWYSISIETQKEAEEAIQYALNELDSLGNEVNTFGKKQTENLTVIGYFNEKIDEVILQKKLDECLQIYGFLTDAVKSFEWQKIENRDWLTEWKKHWKPTETAKFIIAPPWENVETSKKIVIKIEPNMAFGTGTHETTKLCLRAIEENYAPEMSFFDVGTGTGILAVGAAKIRGKSKNVKGIIVGCDTDEDSVKIAVENAELNDADEIEFYVGSISDETPQFDFVCANVTSDVIVSLLPLLVEKTKNILVLSGILVEQESLVTEKLRELKIEDFTVKTDGEWIGITVKL